MRKYKIKGKIIVLLFSVLLFSANGQQVPDSLVKYLEISAKNNPLVMQRWTEYQAALQKVPQATSLPDPELSLGFFLKPMELVNGRQTADIRLMQMFPWFGTLKSAGDEMTLVAEAKFKNFLDARLQIYYEVQRSWYELFKIQKDINISRENIEILKTIERVATVKYQTSSSTNSDMMPAIDMTGSLNNSGLADLYRIQIETSEIKNNISLLRDQYRSVAAQFNSYLDRPPETFVFVPDSLPLDTLLIPFTDVSDSIILNNPILDMIDLESKSMEARARMVKNMGYPMIGIGLNYSLIAKNEMSPSSMNGMDMIMPMVSVSIPIYRKKYRAQISETESLAGAAKYSYRNFENYLQTQFYEAVQNYNDSKNRISLYKGQSELATKSLDLMIKAFSSSESTLTDLLQIQRQILDYGLKQSNALADLNTSIALIRRLMASDLNVNK